MATVPATTTTISAQAVPNDPRVHKFNTDDDDDDEVAEGDGDGDSVVDGEKADGGGADTCCSQRPLEEEEEENTNCEWEKGYVPRAEIRKGSIYANLVFKGTEGSGNSEMDSDARSWHMSYLKVCIFICTYIIFF